MRIPVVLSTVHVTINPNGHLTVDIDGTPHASDQTLHRRDLQTVLDDITTHLQTAVRVEIREADGTTYNDFATPPTATCAPPTTEDPPRIDVPPPAPRPGLNGHGFHPGENVILAYVLCTQTADTTGHTTLALPPALLVRRGTRLLLVGTASATVTEIEQPA